LDEIVLNNIDILRIMSKAFDGLDEVRIQIAEGLRIFGINRVSTAYYNMFIPISSLYEIEESGVTVSTKSFSSLLNLALSDYLTGFKNLSLSIDNDSHATFTITGKYTQIEETLIHVTTGIKTEPPQVRTLNFSRAAKCEVQSPKDYKLVYKHFDTIQSFVNNVEPIEIKVVSTGVELKPLRQVRHLHKLKGKSKGEAKSLVSLPNIKLTSEVADLAGINGLEIYVINNASMKFKYSFNSGFIEYVVSRAIEPEV